ncbi:MAG: carboxypeptidase-like regulatory domain-containing protein [bacterium]|nr:carboxypeptidase-like regulatory domain-containing protein [bacterium]
MYLRKDNCFLLQLYPSLMALLLIIFSLAWAHQAMAASIPPAVISGRVTEYSDSGAVKGLAGIQITAYHPIGITPIGQTVTNADGYYTLNLNLTGWQEIYLCAQDPENQYVTECYEDHYWLYSETGQWGEGNKIGISPNQKITKDFKLCWGGKIPLTIDLPHNRGCVVYLEGTVNYKGKTTMTFPPGNPPWYWMFSDPNITHYSIDLADYILEPNAKVPLPEGSYNIWVKDSTQFFYDLEISNPYCTYSINQTYRFLPQQAKVTITCKKPQADPVRFSSFAQAGMIYGIITDPNTREVTSHLFRVVTEGWHSQSDLVIGFDPNHMDPTNPQISYLTKADSEEQGIEGIQMEIIPVNGQIVERAVIPAKVMSMPATDPDKLAVYHTGSYGGYAFKFLKAGGYKIRAFARVGSSDVFSVFYGQNAYSAENAEVVSLGAGEAKKIDFVLAKTTISGRVVVKGGTLTNISASLLTRSHEQISFTVVNSSTGEFSFQQLLSGDVILRLDKTGYGVVEQTVAGLKLGESRNVGTITLVKYEPCQGSGKIHGRVFSDEKPEMGLANVAVRAMDINYLGQIPCSATTDSQGYFTITGLPNSGFIVYTYHDPNIVKGGYFNEMYDNVTAFRQAEPWCQWEVKRLAMALQSINPSHMDDPNIIITPVYITAGEDKEINIGLSSHQYPFSAGLNLFAYPGTPLKACDTAREFLLLFPSSRRILLGTGGNKGSVMYFDSNSSSPLGNDFAIEPGRGYIFYLDQDIPSLRIPPFTITPPPPMNLAEGRNIISVPDGPDKNLYAQDVLRTLGGSLQEARVNSTAISHFDSRKGKWRSTVWLWGGCAGDNFKVERARGYIADMKRAILWSRPKSKTP